MSGQDGLSAGRGSGPELVIIAAVGAENRVIGKGQDLPWHLPEDLKHFKSLTSGWPCLMGKRTFDSVLHQLGKPLPGRRNLVLTRTGSWPEWPEVEVFASVDKALEAVADVERVFITGGATLYKAFLGRADRLELTEVYGDHEGDVFFPEYKQLIGSQYEETRRDKRGGYDFVTYERKG
ncbi:MAG: dihydrofolate reductase [Bacteroidetes bacterium]|nr:dihydrofolate reductase [Bacteroidota bacterium]